jgi:hypothetical protein
MIRPCPFASQAQAPCEQHAYSLVSQLTVPEQGLEQFS